MSSERNSKIFWKATELTLTVIVIFAAACIAWGSFSQRITRTEADVATLQVKSDAHEKVITQIDTKLTYIQSSVDEIKKELKK